MYAKGTIVAVLVVLVLCPSLLFAEETAPKVRYSVESWSSHQMILHFSIPIADLRDERSEDIWINREWTDDAPAGQLEHPESLTLLPLIYSLTQVPEIERVIVKKYNLMLLGEINKALPSSVLDRVIFRVNKFLREQGKGPLVKVKPESIGAACAGDFPKGSADRQVRIVEYWVACVPNENMAVLETDSGFALDRYWPPARCCPFPDDKKEALILADLRSIGGVVGVHIQNNRRVNLLKSPAASWKDVIAGVSGVEMFLQSHLNDVGVLRRVAPPKRHLYQPAKPETKGKVSSR